MKVKLKVNGYGDRRNVVTALAENGYKVTVESERRTGTVYGHDIIVVVDVPNEDVG